MGKFRVFGGVATGCMVGAFLTALLFANNELALVWAVLAVSSAILAHLE